jgi:hypothetical protein
VRPGLVAALFHLLADYPLVAYKWMGDEERLYRCLMVLAVIVGATTTATLLVAVVLYHL